MTQLTKPQLRQQILQQRQSLSINQWQAKNNAICTHLKSWSLFQSASLILAYFSFRQEPDLSSLFRLNQSWGFPRCVNNSLTWHSWKPGETLEQDKYGILVPLADSAQIQAETVDLILVPAVACDRQKYRLGYGGGYYDRLLSSAKWSNIPTIGIIFDFAFLPQLPVESWDIQLDYICTETGIYSMIN